MEIIIIGLLAFAGYKFFRHTTSAGKETVRAYVYLEALKTSGSQQGANQDADTIMRDLASDQMRNVALMAKHQLQTVHGGKQLPVIGYAYRRGMRPAMPAWYRNMALSAPQTVALDATYGGGTPAPKADEAQANRQPSVGDNYNSFYQSFADEVHRLSGRSGSELNVIDFMGDEPLQRAYRDRVDPLVLAASFCHKHGLTTERYQTYDSYYAAFKDELRRFAADTAQFRGWLESADPARINSSFERGVHPRLAADGYFQFVTQH
ncbi:hypothetical protein ELH88_00980 [Rhizobium ruizarguesonis]|uniref:hypothetical protein n=1 Tax=Rhizobium ruizarguesonis TaxID=2081791 RepID=UPI00102FEFBE|nr:hypothetical protein [Rhizobium ruizarguesonis]TAY45255.1 hypothetical protein ELH87_00975 [Rhizobium ruizarguesonis]TAY55834.1 hypothetical protein ELH88_00980 [Rhizobium ruizarguesonis]